MPRLPPTSRLRLRRRLDGLLPVCRQDVVVRRMSETLLAFGLSLVGVILQAITQANGVKSHGHNPLLIQLSIFAVLLSVTASVAALVLDDDHPLAALFFSHTAILSTTLSVAFLLSFASNDGMRWLPGVTCGLTWLLLCFRPLRALWRRTVARYWPPHVGPDEQGPTNVSEQSVNLGTVTGWIRLPEWLRKTGDPP